MTPDGLDALRFAGVAQLLAQVRDAHVERAIHSVVVAAIELLIELLPRLDLAGMSRKVEQKIVLVARESDFAVTDPHRAGRRVDEQAAELQRALFLRRCGSA